MQTDDKRTRKFLHVASEAGLFPCTGATTSRRKKKRRFQMRGVKIYKPGEGAPVYL